MKVIDILREILGEAGVRKMLEARGGQEVYIPRPENLGEKHWLWETLGPQKERLSLPNPPEGGRVELHRRVVELSLEGKSANFIARATGLHTRSVRRLRARYLE